MAAPRRYGRTIKGVPLPEWRRKVDEGCRQRTLQAATNKIPSKTLSAISSTCVCLKFANVTAITFTRTAICEKVDSPPIVGLVVLRPDVAYANEDGGSVGPTAARLGELWEGLLSDFRLVVITFSMRGTTLQVIFETLNSRGEPLLAMGPGAQLRFSSCDCTRRGRNSELSQKQSPAIFEDPFWSDTIDRGA